MALIVPIYSKSKHVNSYWAITEFKMTLEKIDVVISGYKNRQSRDGKGERGDSYTYSFPIDKNDPDLIDYNSINISYENITDMKIGISLSMKITAKNITPNINKLIDKLLRYSYMSLKYDDTFKQSRDC